jgi:hypothetical protein
MEIYLKEDTCSPIILQNAHPGGATGVQWKDETTLVTTGSDATLRSFHIKHHAA